jgi:serine/threonine protein kinase
MPSREHELPAPPQSDAGEGAARASIPLDAVLPGTPYRVIRLLGAGGMGEVYEAEHELLGARRALKVLLPHSPARSGLAERIKIEARALAKLQHPNLVEVVDLGITQGDGRWYFAMTLLEGRTLREHGRGGLAWHEAAKIVVSVLDGLHAAHGLGLVHRDVKPENTFVCDDGTVKVLDFGIAKVTSLDAITQSGHTIGTPRYMAPEQIEGHEVDRRTDVYSVAVMLYELIAGRAPFLETESIALAYAHVHRAAPPLPTLDPAPATAVRERLARALERGLAKKPGDRFESADAFATELRACLLDAGLTVDPPPKPRRLAGADLADLRGTTTREMGDRTPRSGLRSAPTETLTSDVVAPQAKTSEPVAIRRRSVGRASVVVWGIVLGLLVVAAIVITATRSRHGATSTATATRTMENEASVVPSSAAAAASALPSSLGGTRAFAPIAAPTATAHATGSAATSGAAAIETGSAPRAVVKPRATPKGGRPVAGDAGRKLREDDSIILE